MSKVTNLKTKRDTKELLSHHQQALAYIDKCLAYYRSGELDVLTFLKYMNDNLEVIATVHIARNGQNETQH